MASPFIGEIRIVGFNFAPIGWAMCQGQLLSIAQNDALFALIGTTYGGDGQTTFALPDFRGRLGVHQGQRSGGSNFVMGEVAGVESVTLTTNQIPAHSHLAGAESTGGNQTSPTAGVYSNYATGGKKDKLYSPSANATGSPTELGPAGGNQPHDNLMPYLAINYVIALEGIFPSRN